MLNSAHSAWLLFYNATFHWMESDYEFSISDNFKNLGFVFFCIQFLAWVQKYVCSSNAVNAQGTPQKQTHKPELMLNVQSHLLYQEIFTFSIVCHTPHMDVNSYKMHWNITDQQRRRGGISLGRKILGGKKKMQANHGIEGGEEI